MWVWVVWRVEVIGFMGRERSSDVMGEKGDEGKKGKEEDYLEDLQLDAARVVRCERWGHFPPRSIASALRKQA